MDNSGSSFGPLVQKVERVERVIAIGLTFLVIMALWLIGLAVYNSGYADGARETKTDTENLKAGFTECVGHLKRRAR